MEMPSLSRAATHKVVALALGMLFILLYAAFPQFFVMKSAEANGHGKNIVGWIFAQGAGSDPTPDGVGIGWISMNSDTDGTATPYGVNVNVADKTLPNGIGIISGEAYGENVGWISFDRSNTGVPPSGPVYVHNAHVAWSTGRVTGWARALSVCQHDAGGNLSPAPCVLDVSKSGGWDGWVKLSNGNDNVPATPHAWQTGGAGTPGVRINANTFSGWAWGGDVLGWINFAPTDPTTPDPDNPSNPNPVGPIIIGDDTPGGACSPGDVPSSNWGPCIGDATFCDDASNIGVQVPGVQSGNCPAPSTDSATRSCNTGTFCPTPVCGDGQCTVGETAASCNADCGALALPPCGSGFCGDNICSPGENPQNSPQDCKARWWQF